MVQWPQWRNQERWYTGLRGLLAVLLVIVLAYLLASTIWLLVYGPQDPVADDAGLPRLDRQQSRGVASLSSTEVAGWQLFGVFEAAADDNDKPTEAPDTRLRLNLLGVFRTADPSLSSAIIAEQGKDAELYRIGDRIPGNAVLEEVYADRVILRRAGSLETLRWSEQALSGVSASPAPSPAPARSPRSRQPVISEPESSSSGDSGLPAALPEGDLPSQRAQIVAGLGLTPVSEGSNEGYLLGRQAPRELLQQAGLRPNDVLVSVNGIMLGSEDSDLEALRSYQETQRAMIVVQRGNQQFTVNFPP